jgi:hypothetical protein
LADLHELNWPAIQAEQWSGCKEGKQAEFLMEHSFPWHLIESIGVRSQQTYQQVMNILQVTGQRLPVTIKPEWYY